MLHPSEIASVVTAPFFARSPGPMITALKELLSLPVERTIFVYDRKSPAVARAKRAFARTRADFEAQGRQLVLREVDQFDTAPRWRLGILQAFEDEVAEAVFIFPGDMLGEPTADQRAGWKEMLANADAHALVLGDYQSRDRFKTQFDHLVGLPAVEVLFPECIAILRELGQSKIRTEFVIVGRRVFEHFETATTFSWGTDPTVQLILATLTDGNLTIKTPIWLAAFDDDSETRRPLGQMHQMLRYVAELTIDRMMREMADTDDEEGQLRKYDELRGVVEEIFRRTLAAVDENRAALADRRTRRS